MHTKWFNRLYFSLGGQNSWDVSLAKITSEREDVREEDREKRGLTSLKVNTFRMRNTARAKYDLWNVKRTPLPKNELFNV